MNIICIYIYYNHERKLNSMHALLYISYYYRLFIYIVIYIYNICVSYVRTCVCELCAAWSFAIPDIRDSKVTRTTAFRYSSWHPPAASSNAAYNSLPTRARLDFTYSHRYGSVHSKQKCVCSIRTTLPIYSSIWVVFMKQYCSYNGYL